ncbi:hypothetical protein [Xenorhabdus siamensis]|uniref:hypothetical protein n=1 Tax=Xenorhabdus siamensis TaxID=3136254 RepID=UPI0030F48E43
MKLTARQVKHLDTAIITEGYATALTINQLYKGCVLAALFMVLSNRYDWQLFLEITDAG